MKSRQLSVQWEEELGGIENDKFDNDEDASGVYEDGDEKADMKTRSRQDSRQERRRRNLHQTMTDERD